MLAASGISLKDHVNIVEDYLNWFVGANSVERPDGSQAFSKYLVVACHKKMLKRTSHWTTIGLIYNLAQVDVTELQKAASRVEEVRRAAMDDEARKDLRDDSTL